ncbi:MAG: hypothetical protein ACRBN8_34100 [Nannocystales bacterium]
MTSPSDPTSFLLLQTCYDHATVMTVQSPLEWERIEVVMKRIVDRSSTVFTVLWIRHGLGAWTAGYRVSCSSTSWESGQGPSVG